MPTCPSFSQSRSRPLTAASAMSNDPAAQFDAAKGATTGCLAKSRTKIRIAVPSSAEMARLAVQATDSGRFAPGVEANV